MADEPAGRRQELSRPETLAVKPITIMQTAAERGQQAQTGKAGKTFIVQGDLVVHIDKADDAEELIDDLWEMSEEGGFLVRRPKQTITADFGKVKLGDQEVPGIFSQIRIRGGVRV